MAIVKGRKLSKALRICKQFKFTFIVISICILRNCYSIDAKDNEISGEIDSLEKLLIHEEDVKYHSSQRFLEETTHTDSETMTFTIKDYNKTGSSDGWDQLEHVKKKSIEFKFDDSVDKVNKTNDNTITKNEENKINLKQENTNATSEVRTIKIPVLNEEIPKTLPNSEAKYTEQKYPSYPHKKEMKLGGHPELAHKSEVNNKTVVIPIDFNIKPDIIENTNSSKSEVSSIKPIKVKQEDKLLNVKQEDKPTTSVLSGAKSTNSTTINVEHSELSGYPIPTPSKMLNMSLMEYGSTSSSEELIPPEMMKYLYYGGIGLGLVVLATILICISIKLCKCLASLFSSSEGNKYSEFENEKSEHNVKQFHSASFKNKDDLEIINFRNRELKGELEPAIFYKNEFSKENTGNHRIFELKLDFDSQSDDKCSSKLGTANINNLNKLDLDLELSSKYSNENSEKPEIDVSFI